MHYWLALFDDHNDGGRASSDNGIGCCEFGGHESVDYRCDHEVHSRKLRSHHTEVKESKLRSHYTEVKESILRSHRTEIKKSILKSHYAEVKESILRSHYI